MQSCLQMMAYFIIKPSIMNIENHIVMATKNIIMTQIE